MDSRRDYKKIVGRASKPALAIAREMRPPTALPKAKEFAPGQRSIVKQAGQSPADASGRGQIGYNLFSMGKTR